MKVLDATLEAFALPLRRPLGDLTERRGLLLHLTDEVGLVGLGEASPLPGFSRETLSDARRALEAAALTRSWPDEIARLHAAVAELALPSSAAHALEQALLGLLARRRGVDLAALLAPDWEPSARSVAVHRLVSGPSEARAAVAAGFRHLKLKVGASETVANDVAAVREAAGPEIGLRLDANGRWSRGQAVELIRALAPMAPELIEQPLPADDLDGLASLRGLGVAIAADESVRSPRGLDAVIAAGAADVVVLKPMLVGGLVTARNMARAATSEGLGVYLTTSFDAAVARWGALHVAASVPGLLACGLDTGWALQRDVAAGPVAVGGRMRLAEPPARGRAAWA